MSTTNTAGQTQPYMQEIGVLWTKQGQSQKFLSGVLKLSTIGIDKEIPILVFTNKTKKEDRHPDYRIFLSEPRNPAPAAAAPKAASKPVVKAAKPAPAPEPEPEQEAPAAEDSFL
jgi:hypothetical protein